MKKGKKSFGPTLIMVSIIFGLNLMGINYAQWNKGMTVTTKIKTGVIDAQIVTINVSNPELTESKNGSNLNLLGTMKEGETALVTYHVNNLGTLPVKFGTPKLVERNGLRFDLTSAVKNLNGSTGGDGQFEIIACDSGDYSFTVELPYSLDVQ